VCLVRASAVYMVLSAWFLWAEAGERGYLMRAADDFCRQYERVRLPLVCVLESLPQTGLQVGRQCTLLGRQAVDELMRTGAQRSCADEHLECIHCVSLNTRQVYLYILTRQGTAASSLQVS
jgi:hypothetical protein